MYFNEACTFPLWINTAFTFTGLHQIVLMYTVLRWPVVLHNYQRMSVFTESFAVNFYDLTSLRRNNFSEAQRPKHSVLCLIRWFGGRFL